MIVAYIIIIIFFFWEDAYIIQCERNYIRCFHLSQKKKKKKKRCFHTYQLYQPNLIVKVLYLINIAPTRKENEVPTLPP